MKQNSLYKILIISGFTLWISETWYFGWNDEPCCSAEKVLDMISLTVLYWGIIGDLLSNVVVNKYYLK